MSEVPTPPMETFVLRILQGQVELQCKAVVSAAAELDDALQLQHPDIDGVFIALQGILVAAANLSKLLWGSAGRKAVERTRLRDSLGVPDDSPLKDPELRNDFEHFDGIANAVVCRPTPCAPAALFD